MTGSNITIYEIIIAPENQIIVFEVNKAEKLMESDKFNYGGYKTGSGLNFFMMFQEHFSEM